MKNMQVHGLCSIASTNHTHKCQFNTIRLKRPAIEVHGFELYCVWSPLEIEAFLINAEFSYQKFAHSNGDSTLGTIVPRFSLRYAAAFRLEEKQCIEHSFPFSIGIDWKTKWSLQSK